MTRKILFKEVENVIKRGTISDFSETGKISKLSILNFFLRLHPIRKKNKQFNCTNLTCLKNTDFTECYISAPDNVDLCLTS